MECTLFNGKIELIYVSESFRGNRKQGWKKKKRNSKIPDKYLTEQNTASLSKIGQNGVANGRAANG